jgi:hypothetical protein
MYKPLFLGISNADPVVLYGLLIFLLAGLILLAGIIAYLACYYILKLVRLIRDYSMRKRQQETDVSK